MKVAFLIAALTSVFAIGLGFRGNAQPAAARSSNLIQAVPASWYRELPLDPDLATKSFLERVPPAMRERGELVSQSRYWVLIARSIANSGGLLFFLQSGAASALGVKLSSATKRQWLRDLEFALVLLVFLCAVSLPVEVYANYVRYRAFGFSDQPFAGWLLDYFVEWLSMAVFYAVGIVALMSIIRLRPGMWFFWAGLVYLILATFYAVLTPSVVEPLTNSYVPLPESEPKREILKLAHDAGLPASNIYTDDAAHKSRRLNGHVSGIFGSMRIIIDDTALGSDPAVVESLAAHEMGHYKMHHPLKMVVAASIVATLGFALMAWAAPVLLGHFGGRWHIDSLRDSSAVAIFWLLFVAWGFAADPMTNCYARIQETAADSYSLDHARKPEGLADFMIQDADIARLEPSWLDVVLFYDHPSDAHRVEHAMRWRAAHDHD